MKKLLGKRDKAMLAASVFQFFIALVCVIQLIFDLVQRYTVGFGYNVLSIYGSILFFSFLTLIFVSIALAKVRKIGICITALIFNLIVLGVAYFNISSIYSLFFGRILGKIERIAWPLTYRLLPLSPYALILGILAVGAGILLFVASKKKEEDYA